MRKRNKKLCAEGLLFPLPQPNCEFKANLIVSFKLILTNKVFRNFSYLTIGSILGQLLSLVAIFLLTKLISPEFYGVYTYLISQGLLLVRISSFGNNNIVIRKISRNEELSKNVALGTLVYRLGFILISSLLYVFYDYFFGQLASAQIGLLVIYTLVSSVCFIIEWAFTGQQKMKTVAAINFSTNLTWLLFVIFLIDKNSQPTDIFFLYVLSHFIKMILYLILALFNKIFKGQKVGSVLKSGFSINKESWPYFAMILLLLPLSNLDNNFLDINSTDTEKGYFNLAKRLIGPLSLMNTMLITAIFPNISSMWVDNKEKFQKVLSKGFPIFILVGGVVCFAFSMFCEEVVDLLFDEAYLPAVMVCQIQVWFFLFFSIDFLMGTFLGASNREKTILKFAIIYCIICTPAMFYGSYFGAVGISTALLVSYLIALTFTWRIFKSAMNSEMRSCNISFMITVGLITLSFVITQLYPLNFIFKSIIFLIIGFLIGKRCMRQIKQIST